MTALVIIVANGDGSIMQYGVKYLMGLATSKAFESVYWFPYILTLAVILLPYQLCYLGRIMVCRLDVFIWKIKIATIAINFILYLYCHRFFNPSSDDFSDAMILLWPYLIDWLFLIVPKVREELVKYLRAIRTKKD